VISRVPYINTFDHTVLALSLCYFLFPWETTYRNLLTKFLREEQVKTLQKNGTVEHEISIFWVPRRTLVSNKILEDLGVLGDVNASEFPLYFIPLENDLLSLELDDAFLDMYLVRTTIHYLSLTDFDSAMILRPYCWRPKPSCIYNSVTVCFHEYWARVTMVGSSRTCFYAVEKSWMWTRHRPCTAPCPVQILRASS
jgi:hypothetical protein